MRAFGVDEDLPAALEVPQDLVGTRQGGVVPLEEVADFGDGTVAVVGEAGDDQADAAVGVGFEEDFFEGAAAEFAGAFLDGAVDVVGRHVDGLAFAEDGAQGDVGAGIAAAGARGDGQFLGELGEDLAALGVGGGLLVLDGCPFAVSTHWGVLSLWDWGSGGKEAGHSSSSSALFLAASAMIFWATLEGTTS